MITKKTLLLSIALLVSFTLAACEGSSGLQPQAIDYSQAAHWLSLPAVVEKVDIFYLYPTAWTSTDPDNPHICAIDEPTMLTQAPEAFAPLFKLSVIFTHHSIDKTTARQLIA